MRTFPFGKGAILGALIVGLLVVAACAGPAGTAGPKGDPGPAGPAGKTPTTAELKALVQEAVASPAASTASIARGGRLYNKWTDEAKATLPTGNQALWANQTTNARTGSDTWRCKECHGWDYKGVGGAYGSGSHKTGFPGVIEAGATMTKAQLVGVLKGATNYRHDFSALMKDEDLAALADFLKEGLINVTPYVDYATGKPVGGNAAKGKTLFDATCVPCHGSTGKQILIDGKFGIGDIARDEPTVEMLHIFRTGAPGTPMVSAIVNGWSVPDVVDVLTYVQSLPK